MSKKPIKEPTLYDKEELYIEQIAPLVNEIKKICQTNSIPYICSFATKNMDKETTYENNVLLTGSSNIHLFDDRFTMFLLAVRGAELKLRGHEENMQNKAIDYIMNGYDDTENDEEEMIEDTRLDELRKKNSTRKESCEIIKTSGVENVGDL